jgi:hypothetical protein
MNRVSLLLFLACAASSAAPLQIDVPDLYGQPGSVVSWKFRASADAVNFRTFTSSFLVFESNSSIGFYTDVIASLGGPVNFLLPPGSPDWVDVAGTFQIDPFAALGARNDATLRVLYETYSADPGTCTQCFVSSDFQDLKVSVNVAPVPEPGTALLVALGGAAALLSRRQR